MLLKKLNCKAWFSVMRCTVWSSKPMCMWKQMETNCSVYLLCKPERIREHNRWSIRQKTHYYHITVHKITFFGIISSASANWLRKSIRLVALRTYENVSIGIWAYPLGFMQHLPMRWRTLDLLCVLFVDSVVWNDGRFEGMLLLISPASS